MAAELSEAEKALREAAREFDIFLFAFAAGESEQDYRVLAEFCAQVVLAGNAFPGVDPEAVARALLPAMQAAKPRPALTFTYAKPSPPPRPDYRLVLVFDPANDLNADPVCAGRDMRFRPGRPRH